MPVDETQELQQPQELQQLIMMSGQASDDQVEDVLLRLSEAGLLRARGAWHGLDRGQRVR